MQMNIGLLCKLCRVPALQDSGIHRNAINRQEYMRWPAFVAAMKEHGDVERAVEESASARVKLWWSMFKSGAKFIEIADRTNDSPSTVSKTIWRIQNNGVARYR